MRTLIPLLLVVVLQAEVVTTQVVHTTRVETREDKSEVVSLYTSETIQNDTKKIVVPEAEPTDYTPLWKTLVVALGIVAIFI